MVDTYHFESEEEWKSTLKKYWKNTSYTKYYISKPSSFPCIAIVESSPSGDLGTLYEIDTFIYPSDFNQE